MNIVLWENERQRFGFNWREDDKNTKTNSLNSLILSFYFTDGFEIVFLSVYLKIIWEFKNYLKCLKMIIPISIDILKLIGQVEPKMP